MGIGEAAVEVVGRAKINLFLRVGPRRPDGFHPVETVMQSVGLSDRLTMRRAPATTVHFAPLSVSGHPERPDLIEKALGIFNASRGGAQGAAVEVHKSIPLASGMGGGSADAAAALLGMDALIGARLTREDLLELALRCGSDVPFQVLGGTALATGRGEVLTPLVPSGAMWWVLGFSDEGLGTSDVYRRFDEIGPGGGGDAKSLVEALSAGALEDLGTLLHNDLEAAAFELMPGLVGRKGAMAASGVLGAVMSGSGPAIAGLCAGERQARQAAKAASDAFSRVEVAPASDVGAEVVGAAD